MRIKQYPPETLRWRVRKMEEEYPGIETYIGLSYCGCCDINLWMNDGGDYMVFDKYQGWRRLLEWAEES